jgi:hypothetical protein
MVACFGINIPVVEHQRLRLQLTTRLARVHKLEQLRLLLQEQMHGLDLPAFCNPALGRLALVLAVVLQTHIYGMVRTTPIAVELLLGMQLHG